MKISKSIVFDTNVLVYNQDQNSKFYKDASHYNERALSGEVKAVLTSQSLLEFASVMVNPKKIRKPLSQKVIVYEINKYQESGAFKIIYPNDETIEVFLRLLKKYILPNPKQMFDLFIVATMLSHNITYILTANTKDFPYKEIKVIPLI